MAPSARRHQGKPLPTGGGTPVDTASARHDKQPRRNSRFGGQSPFLTSWASLSATCGRVSRVAKGADCKSAGLRLRRFESYLSHHSHFVLIHFQ